MEIEPGTIVEGKVTHIADFGAFVRFENGQEGLVHISEMADEFVTNIKEYAEVGKSISVFILGLNKNNKLDLSLKKAKTSNSSPSPKSHPSPKPSPGLAPVREPASPPPIPRVKESVGSNFEDKLTNFLKKSEERQIDIRRNLKLKQGLKKKKK